MLTDVQPLPASRPGRLRKAWCEFTGGHDNLLQEAWTKHGTFAVALFCKRCGKQTRFYGLTEPATRSLSKATP